MKKYLPYVIGMLVFIALAALVFFSANNRPRRLNERISLKASDKIPYGFYTARNLLPALFPAAKIYSDKRSPGYWDSLLLTGNNQAVFLVGALDANESELEELMEFAGRGNHVFIICKSLSYDATRFFGFKQNAIASDENYYPGSNDSLRVTLAQPRFNDTTTYIYPGRKYSNSFDYTDDETAIILGYTRSGGANFLQFKKGAGSVYLHTAPLAFSNYFILHKNNIRYYQQALSVIPATVTKIVWNEYYLNKRNEPKQQEPNWLSVLFKYEAFKWAFLTALGTLLLYVLLEMRRKQRIIPVWNKPKNESLLFVQTIGRLYHDQGDHKNLAQKMGAYFLEHVRSRYKLPTNVLDEAFVTALHQKTGYHLESLAGIITYINSANNEGTISEQELAFFHKELEKFYQHT